jgi:hypothetical protein
MKKGKEMMSGWIDKNESEGGKVLHERLSLMLRPKGWLCPKVEG